MQSCSLMVIKNPTFDRLTIRLQDRTTERSDQTAGLLNKKKECPKALCISIKW